MIILVNKQTRMVAQAHNPRYLGEDRRIKVKAILGKMLARPHLKEQSGCMPVIPATMETKPSLCKTVRPYLKNN
jgi:hypothetical protein